MKILFAGESWMIEENHLKGFDLATLCRFEDYYAEPLFHALEAQGISVDYYQSHKAQVRFPDTAEELKQYDAIVLSDIGSNTLLLDPDMQFRGNRKGNRLLAIKEYVAQGGALLMCGGYFSFAGIENKARYAMTPLAEVLPVEILNYDDRMEHPEGVVPVITCKDHPVMKNVANDWPFFFGYNKVKAKEEAEEIATIDGDTFMAGMDYGKGRSFAFASDCAPHWGPKQFVEWESYGTVFANIIKWLAKKEI